MTLIRRPNREHLSPLAGFWDVYWPFGSLLDEALRGSYGDCEGALYVPADVREEQGDVVLSLDLPGVKQENVDVSIDGNTLTVKGQRRYEAERKDEHAYRLERAYGSFQRSFTLPSRVDPVQVQATYKDGVLEIRVPKMADTPAKKITVQS